MRARASELRKRLAQLKAERSPLEPLYRKLQRYILPETGRFEMPRNEDSESGYEYIYDATATDAIDVLGAGMLGGMTSPARPWFRLTTRSPELDENGNVKRWLADVQREMLMVFAKSNVYQALNNAYLELACYGTACLVALPSDRHVIHLHEMTMGDYWIEEDAEHRVNTVYRQILMTAEQMVDTFGKNAVSKRVLKAYENPATCFQTFTVIQAIEPRPEYDRTKKDKLNMPYRSVYFEEQEGTYANALDADNIATSSKDRILREEGFKSFPCLVPRWTASKRSPYGRSPGMKALGVVMALQEETAIKDRSVDYTVNPPVLVPEEYESKPLDFGPGGVSYCNLSLAQQVKTAWDVKLDLSAVSADIQDKRQSINNYFYKDLFMMLAQTARYGRTAYEVEKLDKEKMLIMGPVLERLHLELLDPLIASTLQCMERFGLIPEIPDELKAEQVDIFGERRYVDIHGEPYREATDDAKAISEQINIEYVSILAQAQRAAGVDAMSTYVQSLAGASQVWSNAVDMLDVDKWCRTLADQLGVDPELIPSQEEADAAREQRAQQMQQTQQLDAMQKMASAAKDIPQVSQDQIMAGMTQYAG
nr:MAG TPA: head to tail connecting protein [Caudoviricetes sp.]